MVIFDRKVKWSQNINFLFVQSSAAVECIYIYSVMHCTKYLQFFKSEKYFCCFDFAATPPPKLFFYFWCRVELYGNRNPIIMKTAVEPRQKDIVQKFTIILLALVRTRREWTHFSVSPITIFSARGKLFWKKKIK